MNFKYTPNSSKFTKDQRIFYEQNGYIVIKNNVPDDLLDKLYRRFVDICEGNAEFYSGLVIKDPSLKMKGAKGEYLINKLQDFLYDEVLWEYVCNKEVVDVVQNIIGPNITATHSMFINKPPDSDPNFSLHPLHQDLHYFPFRPADKIVASWTALERVDEKNGCLYVVAGSHNSPLYEHTYPKNITNAMYHGVKGMDHLPKVKVIMEKGDTVFFHSLLLHGSGPNISKGFRKAISCHYADTNCYFIDVKNTIQQSLAEEVENVLTKKGATLNFLDYWKMKSRLVRGAPGNFQKLDSHL